MKYILPHDLIHDGLSTMAFFVVVLTLSDSPVEAEWHMHGFLKHGGTEEELREVARFSLKLVQMLDVKLLGSSMDVEKVIKEHPTWDEQFS
jgi:hypothetical protein